MKNKPAKTKKEIRKEMTVILIDRNGGKGFLVQKCDKKGKIQPLPDAIFHGAKSIYLVEANTFLKGAHHYPEKTVLSIDEDVPKVEYVYGTKDTLIGSKFRCVLTQDYLNSLPKEVVGAKAEGFLISRKSPYQK